MRPPAWQEHPDDVRTIANNIAVLDAKIAANKGGREIFTLELAKSWHSEIHHNCRYIPSPVYVGNFRGSDHPHLVSYGVKFDKFLGTGPGEVENALLDFASGLNEALGRLDALITTSAAATPSRLNAVLECAARYYALWLRIHPFADGNGRTSRVLVNWILARYWQPLLFPGRPPADRDGLIAASTPAVDPVADDCRALTRYMRRRLMEARRRAGT